MLEMTLHPDGSVTYWSVYRQIWETDYAWAVPDRELAAMSEREREAIRAHARARRDGDEA